MGKNRFVRPSTVRLDISDGDWIEISERLAWGDMRRMAAAQFQTFKNTNDGEGEIGIDPSKTGMARMLAWVRDWSFEDEKGKRVAVTQDSIDALDPDTALEILEAIDRHSAAYEESKNLTKAG